MALQIDLPAVFGIDTGQDLDQGRFAGPVLAHQRMDLSFPQGEIYILKCLYAGKDFVDVMHFKNSVFCHI